MKVCITPQGPLRLAACALALLSALLTALLTALQPAWAGRPLASDDAGTADAGTCQVEGWSERTRSERALVIAPACGMAPGLELGLDYTVPRPRDTVRASSGLALKWVPEAARVGTPVGEINFGLKVSAAFERPAAQGWQRTETGLLALATLKADDALTVHANLGWARAYSAATTAALLNLALAWTPSAHAVFFAEIQANSKRAAFGGTLSSAGARWWLVKDRFGLDLTASRQAGAGSGTLWTVGLGWYGLEI